jgi:hypothetical protein
LFFFIITTFNIELIRNYASWFFSLIFMRLSWSHEPSHKFYELIRNFLLHPFLNWFLFFFYPLTMAWLLIEFRNLFWFIFNRVIFISWLKLRFGRLTWVDSNYFFSFFHEIILVLWPMLWVWWVNSSFCYCFFSISSLKFIGIWTSLFLSFCFVWGYLHLINSDCGFDILNQVVKLTS